MPAHRYPPARHIHVVAADLDQAAHDLTDEWSDDRRQRWTLDTDTAAKPGDRVRPRLATRVDDTLRAARNRAELHARQSVAGLDQMRTEVAAQLAALEPPRAAGRGGLSL